MVYGLHLELLSDGSIDDYWYHLYKLSSLKLRMWVIPRKRGPLPPLGSQIFLKLTSVLQIIMINRIAKYQVSTPSHFRSTAIRRSVRAAIPCPPKLIKLAKTFSHMVRYC